MKKCGGLALLLGMFAGGCDDANAQPGTSAREVAADVAAVPAIVADEPMAPAPPQPIAALPAPDEPVPQVDPGTNRPTSGTKR